MHLIQTKLIPTGIQLCQKAQPILKEVTAAKKKTTTTHNIPGLLKGKAVVIEIESSAAQVEAVDPIMHQQFLEGLLIEPVEAVDLWPVEAMEVTKCQVANTTEGNILKFVLVLHQIG